MQTLKNMLQVLEAYFFLYQGCSKIYDVMVPIWLPMFLLNAFQAKVHLTSK